MTVNCVKCGVTIPENALLKMCPICKDVSTIVCFPCYDKIIDAGRYRIRPCNCYVSYALFRL